MGENITDSRYLNRIVGREYVLGHVLAGMSNEQIGEVIRMFKEMGVKKVAPTHRTGEKATAFFRQAWSDNFLEGGLGAIIE